jgi:hypothetical protein
MYESFLTADDVHEEEVDLSGTIHKVWFREVPHLVYARFVRESSSPDVADRDAAAARFVAGSLCNPDGTLAFTGEEACRLKSSVVNAMVPLIVKVSKAVDPGKASPPEA